MKGYSKDKVRWGVREPILKSLDARIVVQSISLPPSPMLTAAPRAYVKPTACLGVQENPIIPWSTTMGSRGITCPISSLETLQYHRDKGRKNLVGF